MAALRTLFNTAPRPEPILERPVISVGQALLILIDHYHSHKPIRQKLCYFLGVHPTSADRIELEEKWLKDPILKHYQVSLPPKKEVEEGKVHEEKYNSALCAHYHVINSDPTRRYFETQLAQATLYDPKTLNSIDIADMNAHYALLQSFIPLDVLAKIKDIFAGDFTHASHEITTDALCAKEYADLIQKFESKEDKNQQKIQLFAKCSYLAVVMPRYRALPLDLYSKGFYLRENRGVTRKFDEKEDKEQQLAVRSPVLGLMKNYMPMPLGDVASAPCASSYLRVADRHTFNPKAAWTMDNFSYLTQPFSCSISGTMLIHLRIFKYLATQGQLVFFTKDKLANYLKSLVSLMIFNSGGHSFHEFMYPLALPDVRAGFSFMKDFESINSMTLFYEGNEKAFDEALKKTIAYNKVIVGKAAVHHEILSRGIRMKL